MCGMIKELLQWRELIAILIARNLKIRYKSSVLGFFWSLLSPLFLIVIYSVFLGVLRFAVDLPALVCGIFVWQFLAMCMGDALFAVVGNANLVTKTAFPRTVLPVSMVAANLVNFLFSCIVLVIYLIAVRANPGPLWLLPAVLLLHTALCLGIGCLFSSLNVFFRDMEHILSVVMLAWFFLSPVIYSIDRVTDHFGPVIQTLFFANPMTGILTGYRVALLGHPFPPWPLMALSWTVALVIFAVGVTVYRQLESRFADEL